MEIFGARGSTLLDLAIPTEEAVQRMKEQLARRLALRILEIPSAFETIVKDGYKRKEVECVAQCVVLTPDEFRDLERRANVASRMVLRNRHGSIPIGTKVRFEVENQSLWVGHIEGVLEHTGAEFVINTEEGLVTIGRGYDAYINTIRPVEEGT